MASIYVLLDPRTGEIRYVGWTSKTPEVRLRNHLRSQKHTHTVAWVRKLKRLGLRPILRVIQTVELQDGPEAERYWIAFFKDVGCALTNHTEGGEGCPGHRHSAETKAKISLAVSKAGKGKPHPWQVGKPRSSATKEKLRAATIRQFENPEARAQVSAVHSGKTISETHKKRISEWDTKRWEEWRQSGKTLSAESRQRISDSKKGKPLSAEHKAKLSKASKGKPKSEEHRRKLGEANRRRAAANKQH